jgi:hypothetical protein
VGERGERIGQIVDDLGRLAELGFTVAHGQVTRAWEITPLELIGTEVLPAVRGLASTA